MSLRLNLSLSNLFRSKSGKKGRPKKERLEALKRKLRKSLFRFVDKVKK